jgi:hypothetical protein
LAIKIAIAMMGVHPSDFEIGEAGAADVTAADGPEQHKFGEREL